jgi:Uma2 family endonuclease
MAISERRLTLEEFLELPEEEPALELICGQVVQKVSPKGPHGRIQMRLGVLIDTYAEPRRLGLAFSETRTSFGGASPVPDVVFYRWERVPRTPEGRIADDFTTPPDLAIEIISPSQRRNPLIRRCHWYVENGVRIALLIDPGRETAMLFRPGAEPIMLAHDEQIDLEELLPGFRLTPRQLFEALYLR